MLSVVASSSAPGDITSVVALASTISTRAAATPDAASPSTSIGSACGCCPCSSGLKTSHISPAPTDAAQSATKAVGGLKTKIVMRAASASAPPSAGASCERLDTMKSKSVRMMAGEKSARPELASLHPSPSSTPFAAADETVADADDCFDGLAARVEFLPQATDVYVERARVAEILVAPDIIQKLLAR